MALANKKTRWACASQTGGLALAVFVFHRLLAGGARKLKTQIGASREGYAGADRLSTREPAKAIMNFSGRAGER